LVQPEQVAAQAAVLPTGRLLPRRRPRGFEEFYRGSYRELVGTAMLAGARKEEAEDAASKTLADMLRIWPVDGHPIRYARKAVVNNFIKDKTRGNLRVALRLIERGHVPTLEGAEDQRLTDLEDCEWVTSVLSVLSPAQREVMECIACGLSREETAEALGKSRDTVRRHLCDARSRLARLLDSDGEPRQLPGTTTTRTHGEEAEHD
jgi:RNA polymerase sigma factor (sigma-70 family)